MSPLKWWQSAVFYQIYPRSFADGNGDGISDFVGMTAKLDYLQDLGIDAVWISPHFPSPQADCGYDVSDYTNVAPEYGTLADFKRFLDEAHRREIRVILDLVLNHTSDQHEWFKESRSSRDNPKRDWYIWRDATPETPPNNWNSYFGGSAWEHDPATQQSYYHMFLKEQPDLNWRNPEVKKAMWDAVRFWLDMGVDGYRLDAIGTIFENPEFPDHPVAIPLEEIQNMRYSAKTPEDVKKMRAIWRSMMQYQTDQPGLHELMKELRQLVDEYEDKVLVGEADQIAYYGNGNDELHLVFNFPLMHTNRLTPDWIRQNQKMRLPALPAGAWPCNTLGNHDSSRLISHFGDGIHDMEIARIGLALMLTLKGTPFLYNGEEIGMTDLILTDFSQIRDWLVRWRYKFETETLNLPVEVASLNAGKMSRDRCRTPMQWCNAPNAGFSPAGVQTWLPVNPNYQAGVNVEDQLKDQDSLLNFYKRMLRLRRNTPALVEGEYVLVNEDAKEYLAFLRTMPGGGQKCLVILNMSEESARAAFSLDEKFSKLLFSSNVRNSKLESTSELSLAPFEIYIGELIKQE
ncbi:MAG TPA: alpha-amylase family glycosyl hydrolase [Anaerolineaceae bacterium]